MEIRAAGIEDAEDIGTLYLRAFDAAEAGKVAGFAVSLLTGNHPVKTISLVAMENNEVAGHIAFSPVLYADTGEHFAYILAPLAVSPELQKTGIGTSLVRYGLDDISRTGASIVFVYGDPQYYSRFGFETGLAGNFTPPHALQFPEGWQALKLNPAAFPVGGAITCIDSLNDPELW